jgi:hypothetical protein
LLATSLPSKSLQRTRFAPVFNAITVRTNSAPYKYQFVDTTSANIHLAAGQTLVIEWECQNEGCNLFGNYVAPPGAPGYPETLFRGGTP